MKDWRAGYICSKDQTPEPFREVWLRVAARRPRKASFNSVSFDYINKELRNAGMYCSVGKNFYWRYVK